MKELTRMVAVLGLICLLAGMLLAGVRELTAERIAQTERAVKLEALSQVLPACDNQPDADTVSVGADGAQWTFYRGRKGRTVTGVAFETRSGEGYGGEIRVMAGLDAADAVYRVAILSHRETPGLGARIAEPSFRARFAGKRAGATRWAVRKDGGEIQEITSATVSSRAVVRAVARGLKVYLDNKREIMESPSGGQPE